MKQQQEEDKVGGGEENEEVSFSHFSSAETKKLRKNEKGWLEHTDERGMKNIIFVAFGLCAKY